MSVPLPGLSRSVRSCYCCCQDTNADELNNTSARHKTQRQKENRLPGREADRQTDAHSDGGKRTPPWDSVTKGAC